jgi:hypothetical protein
VIFNYSSLPSPFGVEAASLELSLLLPLLCELFFEDEL